MVKFLLLGKLQTDDELQLFNRIAPKKAVDINGVDRKSHASKNTIIGYKVNPNAINVSLHVLSNKRVLKVTELAESGNDFNHLINVQVLNASNGHVMTRLTEQIGMHRVKKAHACQNYLAILLTNQFLGNYSCLQLYETTSELKLIGSLELEYRPVDVYLNERAIYVVSNKSNSFIHKYNLELKHLKSFGQSSKEKEPFYIPKYFRLESVLHEEATGHVEQRIYFVDYENLKIRIMNESSGKYVKKVNINTHEQATLSGMGTFGKNILIQIDAESQRIFILNRKLFKVSILNWDGMLISRKDIDTNVQNVDKFFLINDNMFSVVDYENQLIHFF